MDRIDDSGEQLKDLRCGNVRGGQEADIAYFRPEVPYEIKLGDRLIVGDKDRVIGEIRGQFSVNNECYHALRVRELSLGDEWRLRILRLEGCLVLPGFSVCFGQGSLEYALDKGDGAGGSFGKGGFDGADIVVEYLDHGDLVGGDGDGVPLLILECCIPGEKLMELGNNGCELLVFHEVSFVDSYFNADKNGFLGNRNGHRCVGGSSGNHQRGVGCGTGVVIAEGRGVQRGVGGR